MYPLKNMQLTFKICKQCVRVSQLYVVIWNRESEVVTWSVLRTYELLTSTRVSIQL